MSVTGFSNSEKLVYQKSFYGRKNSGELGLFEASQYFSVDEVPPRYNGATIFSQKIKGENCRQAWRVGRISLDLPMRKSIPNSQTNFVVEKQIKEKKHKQLPSSPGGKLASFLNSLFNQTSSKKKKSKSKTTTQSLKDEDESPVGRRKRSSISHFGSRSFYSSSSSSGFRTPPPYSAKIHRDLKSFSDQKEMMVFSLSKQNGHVHDEKRKPPSIALPFEEKRKVDRVWLDEKLKFNKVSGSCSSDKHMIIYDKGFSGDKEFRKLIAEDDDGEDSDSSSDLFELQNYDLGYCPNDLPVYETTNMSNIKIGAPISINGPV